MKRTAIECTVHFLRIILLSFGIILNGACKKDKGSKDDISPEPIEVDVYVAGIKKVEGIERPFFLKNGEEHMLAYNGNVSAIANDIFVKEGNVYVVGYINSDLSFQYRPKSAVLWKNGAIQNLEMPESTIRSEATAVFVSGNDVFVAGRYRKYGGTWIASVWKNGKITDVTDGSNEARLYDVFVQGDDIYLTGYEINDDIGTQGKYWKNGISYVLENRNSENIVPHQISVNGNDIFVVGTGFGGAGQTAQYWKNGVQTILPSTPAPVNYGHAIATTDSHVYIGGTLDNQPTVWKNSTSLNWNINPDPAIDSELSDMKVIKGNIFATGWTRVGSARKLWIWKNGQEYFSSGSGIHYTPTGLFVVER